MKPKTKLQKYVVELSAKLSPITAKQVQWGIDKCHTKFVVRSRGKSHCLECGHAWTEDSPALELLTSIESGCECPSCGSTLKLREYKRSFRESVYFGILTTKKDMQVVRVFKLDKFMQKGEKPSFAQTEVMQHWIDEKGNITTMSLAVNGLSRYYDEWITGSDFEIRVNRGSYHSEARHDIVPYAFYPEKKILPIIKRNGFRGYFYDDFIPQKMFSMILKDPRAEQLLKAKQLQLLKARTSDYLAEKQDKFWPSIMICIRHGYIVTKASDYLDYLQLLEYFGKDLRSPHYVCPESLHKAHNRLVEKKRMEDLKKKIEKLRKEIEQAQAEYEKAKKAYFGIAFVSDDIEVKVLTHVQEFYEEGDAMHHCVFSNKYYERPDSLVLSARRGNERLETVELSLKDYKIMQSRGLHNQQTEYHDKIVNLVTSNIDVIRKISLN